MKELLVKPEPLQALLERELPPQPCYISPGVLPKGGTLLFGGHSKVGKSFILLEIARALATGVSPFGYNALKVHEPTRVLLVEQEVGAYGLQDRGRLIFQEEDVKVYGPNLFYVSKVPEMQLNTDKGRKLLTDLVAEVEPQVLILDPIGRFHSYDENRSDQIQNLFTYLEWLVQTNKHNDMSLVMSHHFGKPSGDPKTSRDPLDPYNFRGSSKWFDNPDTLITVARGKNLACTHKAWNIHMRLETRQAEPPPDILLTVNRDKDLRVRFEHTMGEVTPALDKIHAVKPQQPKQMRFIPG